MPVLAPNVAVSSTQPVLRVENRFQPGVRVFRLTVVDDHGNESLPALLSVVVVRAGRGGTGNLTEVLQGFLNTDRPLRPEG